MLLWKAISGLAVATVLASAVLAQAPAKRTPAEFQAQLWAVSCMACHGPLGRAAGAGLTIGGRPTEELYKLLLDYKNGRKTGTVMHQHAKGYNDDELQRISAFFSTLK